MACTLLSGAEACLRVGEHVFLFKGVAEAAGNHGAGDLQQDRHEADATVVVHVCRIALLKDRHNNGGLQFLRNEAVEERVHGIHQQVEGRRAVALRRASDLLIHFRWNGVVAAALAIVEVFDGFLHLLRVDGSVPVRCVHAHALSLGFEKRGPFPGVSPLCHAARDNLSLLCHAARDNLSLLCHAARDNLSLLCHADKARVVLGEGTTNLCIFHDKGVGVGVAYAHDLLLALFNLAVDGTPEGGGVRLQTDQQLREEGAVTQVMLLQNLLRFAIHPPHFFQHLGCLLLAACLL